MALERGKLSNVVQVAAGATVGIITVASSKKVYVKSIIAHTQIVVLALQLPRFTSVPLVLVVRQQIKFLILTYSLERRYYLNHHIPLC